MTENAIDAIKKVAPGEAGLRLFTQTTDGADDSLYLEVAEEPREGDEVLDVQGAHLFLAPTAATLVEDKVLDASQEGSRVRFALASQG